MVEADWHLSRLVGAAKMGRALERLAIETSRASGSTVPPRLLSAESKPAFLAARAVVREQTALLHSH